MNAQPLSHQLSRRGFVQGAAGIAAMATLMSLAACAPGGSSKAASLVGLLPGDQPGGWDAVAKAVNKKMQEELGFGYDGQYIPWASYAQNELLKFTSGEKFDLALEARWLHLDQLISDGALADLTAEWDSNKYPDLKKTVDQKLIDYVKTDGTLFAIPQMNTAGVAIGFIVRQDLSDKYGIGNIENYQQFEKYLYEVKQRESGMIPYGLDLGYVNNTCLSGPVGLFNEASWENPTHYNQSIGGAGATVYMDLSDVENGNSRPLPFWEQPGILDAIKKVRKYNLDGIINTDSVTADTTTIQGQFSQGLYASTEVNTDGLTTSRFAPTLANIPGSSFSQVLPFKDGLNQKVTSTFSVANYVVVNAGSDNVEKVMQMQNWLSKKENHDLVAYGIEGKDWEAVGDDKYKSLSSYAFPTFALAWRVPLERSISTMVESETNWLNWAKDFDNFVPDPYAGFLLKTDAISAELAQLSAAYTQYALPLWAGSVDSTQGLSDAQKAFEAAGYEKVLDEVKTQADAFLKNKK